MKAETGSPRAGAALAVGFAACLALLGCRQDMHDQAKLEPLEASPLFGDGMASRPLVAHAVPRGFLREDEGFATGRDGDGTFLDAFPMEALKASWKPPVPEDDSAFTRAVLRRGQQRFGIFCTPCHDRVGSGNGMIVQRGFKKPDSFHGERLRGAAVGYYVNVMTEGFGQMSSYAAQVKPEDRWAIAAYIRALQLSQRARLNELEAEDRQKVLTGTTAEHTSAERAAGRAGH